MLTGQYPDFDSDPDQDLISRPFHVGWV